MTNTRTPRLISLILALLLVTAQPSAILAAEGEAAPDTPPAVVTEETPPASPVPTAEPTTPVTGPTEPVGAQEPTGPQKPTGVVPDYAFNDATQHWDPTVQSSFYWDAGVGRYVSPLYRYDTQVGWYHVIPQAPAPAAATTSAAATATPSGPAVTSAAAADPEAALAALLGLSDPSIANTGPGSTNTGAAASTSDLLLQLLGQSLIHNDADATATSGDATVAGNTIAGSATTGPATIIQNLLNLLNAVWSWSSGGLTTFIKNLFGDHTGDLLLQPQDDNGGGGQLGAAAGGLASNSTTGPNSTNSATQDSDTDITVINRPSGAITNDIDLLATSGKAVVTGNGQAGSATSGDATVGLNILNLINSAITANQSFFGLLNIFGNLNGDILFPDGFLDGLLGGGAASADGASQASNSNTGPNSTNTAATDQSNTLNVTNQSNASAINNINAGAQSGAANVSGNTSAGSAATGQANVNTNLFNLLNTDLFGDNAVLVLVNVMGRWVGRIVNMPTGGSSTGALLTGNAVAQNSDTGPGSINTASTSSDTDVTLVNQPTGSITNNIRAGAVSGDASVSNNTTAGDARSGNANVATNVANIFGSQLSLKKWFGVLVINVFGDWTGSVGEDTAAGTVSVALATVAPAGVGAAELAASTVDASSVGSTEGLRAGAGATSNDMNDLTTVSDSPETPVVVAAAHNSTLEAAQDAAAKTGWLLVAGAIVMLLAGGLFAAERRLSR